MRTLLDIHRFCPRRRFIGSWCVWLSGILILAISTGRAARGQQFPVTQYGVKHGIPPVPVTQIAPGPDGELWVGTRGAGLLRMWGGPTVEAFGLGEGLAGNVVADLAVGEDALWVGTRYGVTRLGPEGAKSRRLDIDLTRGEITSVLHDARDTLWVGTTRGAVRVSTRSVEDSSRILRTHRIVALAQTNNNIWIGSNRGLFRYSSGMLRRVALPAEHEVRALQVDARNRLWIGTSRGLFRKEPAMPVQAVEHSPSYAVRTLAPDRRGGVWVGTDAQGVFRIGAGEPLHLTRANGLCSNRIRALAHDRVGNLWVGTAAQGICSVTLSAFQLYPEDARLGVESIGALVPAAEGGAWIGMGTRLVRWHEGRFRETVGADTIATTITALANGPRGIVWVGANHVLYRHDGQGLQRVEGHLPTILSLHSGSDETVWIGTIEGLVRWEEGTLDTIQHSGRYPVWDLHEDGSGRVWIAGGIRGGVMAQSASGDPLMLPDSLADYPAVALAEDAGGGIWVGSNQWRDLLRVSVDQADIHLERFGMVDGLLKSSVRFMSTDRNGRLWIGHQKGVSRIDRAHVASEEMVSVRTYPLTRLNAGALTSNGAVEDEAGHLWIGTEGGLLHYNTAEDPEGAAAPPIWIASIHAGRNAVYTGRSGLPEGVEDYPLRLEEGDQPIEFTYRSVGLADPSGVQYQYRIDGSRSTWSPLQPANNVVLPPLGAGAYAFEVRAVSANRAVSQVPASVAFRVVPPWWRRTWTWIGGGLSLVVLVVGGLQYRTRQINRRRELLEKLVANRTKALYQEKEKLEAANEKLEKLSLVASSTDTIVYIADLSGNIEWVNSAFERETGYSLAELEACQMGTLQAVSSRDDMDALIASCIEDGQAVTYESVLVRKDGAERWYSSTLSIIEETLHRSQRLVIIDVDITERVQLEQELVAAREAALSASRAKSAFLATMSHEIRTPLNGVIGMSSLLESTTLSADQREYVDVIQTSAQSLLDLISDILDFSKIEAERIDLAHEPIRVYTVVEEALDLVRRAAAEKDLVLAAFIDDNVPAQVEGDATRLRQVLANLLSNAVKFTAVGSVVVRVEGADATDASHVHLQFSVTDTGVGIPPEKQETIFDVFTQIDSSNTREYGGTGLGLAISQRLTEAMRGRMWLESTEGAGSTFYFTAEVGVADGRPWKEDVRARHSIAIDRCLVFVEKDTERRMLRALLDSWDVSIDVVEQWEDVRATWDASEHDIIFFDSSVPTREVKALRARVPAVSEPGGPALVRLVAINDRRPPDGQTLGFSVTKPVKVERLHQVLRYAEDSPPVGQVSSTGRESHVGGPVPSIDVLVVEDDVVNRKVLLRLLQRIGYEPVLVNNGREALEAFQDVSFDLVFMDVQMPVMDGLETTRKLRAAYGSDPFIIALTASAMEEDRERCIRSGMNAFLTKPVELGKLQEILRASLGTIAESDAGMA